MIKNQGKIIIVVSRQQDLALARRLECNFSKSNKSPIIIYNTFNSKHNTLKFRTLKTYQDEFEIEYHDVLQDAHSLMNSFGETSIKNGVSLKDFTHYQCISLWEMNRRFLLGELVPFVKEFKLIRKILEVEAPSEVIMLDGSGRIGKIFETICAYMKIHSKIFTRKGKTFFLYNYIKIQLSNIGYSIKKIFRFTKSVYFFIINNPSFRRIIYNKKKVIVFFSYVERCLEAIIPVIQKYNHSERLVINMPGSSCEKRLKSEKIGYKYFLGYKIYSFYNKKLNNFLNNIWDSLSNDVLFQNKLNYQNINLWILLRESFWNLIFRRFPESIYHVDAMKNVLLFHNIKAVVIVDYAGEITLPAMNMGFPTISVLSNTLVEFFYYADLQVDYISVTGKCWQDILLRSGIKYQRMALTGPTKFDIVFKSKFDREKILKNLGLNPDKKTIIYAGTYPCESMGYSYVDYITEIRDTFSNLKNIKDINVIAKVHPYDSKLKLYKKIAKEEKLKDLLIIRDTNIWKLLHCCDLVITNISTMSYEAVWMDRNVILFFMTNKYYSKEDKWTWDFKNTMPVVFIDNFSNLEEATRLVLYEKKMQLLLKENRAKYISGHASPLDGNASNRVKHFIDTVTIRA